MLIEDSLWSQNPLGKKKRKPITTRAWSMGHALDDFFKSSPHSTLSATLWVVENFRRLWSRQISNISPFSSVSMSLNVLINPLTRSITSGSLYPVLPRRSRSPSFLPAYLSNSRMLLSGPSLRAIHRKQWQYQLISDDDPGDWYREVGLARMAASVSN